MNAAVILSKCFARSNSAAIQIVTLVVWIASCHCLHPFVGIVSTKLTLAQCGNLEVWVHTGQANFLPKVLFCAVASHVLTRPIGRNHLHNCDFGKLVCNEHTAQARCAARSM